MEGDNWLIVYFANGIPNLDYHWILHDNDPKFIKKVVETILHYQHTSKDHNKDEALGTKLLQFADKCKTPNKFLDHNFK